MINNNLFLEIPMVQRQQHQETLPVCTGDDLFTVRIINKQTHWYISHVNPRRRWTRNIANRLVMSQQEGQKIAMEVGYRCDLVRISVGG